jgi:hypothetical protein
VGLRYKGKPERPLSPAERRRLVLLAVVTVLGLVAWLAGAMIGLPRGQDPLGRVLLHAA